MKSAFWDSNFAPLILAVAISASLIVLCLGFLKIP
jgi:hypothetical protein